MTEPRVRLVSMGLRVQQESMELPVLKVLQGIPDLSVLRDHPEVLQDLSVTQVQREIQAPQAPQEP